VPQSEDARSSGLWPIAARQLAGELRELPATLARHAREEGRAARCLSVDDLRRAARRSLPAPAFDFVDGGAAEEVTVRRNRAAFAAFELKPRILRDVSTISLTTSVLGERIAFPIIGAPHGAGLLFHQDAERGIVRALNNAGTLAVISVLASQTLEELAHAATGPKWFQMYIWRDRGLTRELLERARATGRFSALMITVDTPRVGPRERDARNGFTLPPRMTLRSVRAGLLRPRWSARVAFGPPIGLANFAGLDLASVPSGIDAGLTWKDLAWVREQWPGPIVLKGILSAEDAICAAEVGVDALSVSNHGGRQLDHAMPAIVALPCVIDAVGDRVEVYMDGGVRRGTDLAKALALGARACLTARPFLYGLAVAGEPGVHRAITLMRDDLELTMALLGCPTITALASSLVAPVGHTQSGP
jgi:isopentenyl diphosphate isomerase/L-lactate dehydrogenase-like FMN-dependent dehydrogenase